MTVATQIEILDLRHFTARQMRSLLEAEAQVWEKRLRWNYQSAIELLLQYVDSRILPGFVAIDRGRICGYAFCVYEGQKAVVGDAFASANDPDQVIRITQTLLQHLLELLLHSPNIQRVESQLLLYDAGAIEATFLEAGFVMHPRLFMEYDLPDTNDPFHAPNGTILPPDLPTHIELSPWSPDYYQQAAELIHEAYTGHIDATESWLLRDTRSNTNTLAGMVLCSRVADDVAHITQLCIAPPYRGAGLGRFLLKHATNHLARSGFRAITLTVTEANHQAVQLYEDLGFFTRHRFDAMVLDKTQP